LSEYTTEWRDKTVAHLTDSIEEIEQARDQMQKLNLLAGTYSSIKEKLENRLKVLRATVRVVQEEEYHVCVLIRDLVGGDWGFTDWTGPHYSLPLEDGREDEDEEGKE